MNLKHIAAKLEDEEKLVLKYRAFVGEDDHAEWIVRTDRLLDVSEERHILYVDRDGDPVWVRIEEAIEVFSDNENK